MSDTINAGGSTMGIISRLWDEVRIYGPGHRRRIAVRVQRMYAEQERRAAATRRARAEERR